MTDAVTPSRSPSGVTPGSIMRIGLAIIRLTIPRHVHDGLESQLARCIDAWSEISPASATRRRRGGGEGGGAAGPNRGMGGWGPFEARLDRQLMPFQRWPHRWRHGR